MNEHVMSALKLNKMCCGTECKDCVFYAYYQQSKRCLLRAVEIYDWNLLPNIIGEDNHD